MSLVAAGSGIAAVRNRKASCANILSVDCSLEKRPSSACSTACPSPSAPSSRRTSFVSNFEEELEARPSRSEILASVGLVHPDADGTFGDKGKFVGSPGTKCKHDSGLHGLELPLLMSNAIRERERRNKNWISSHRCSPELERCMPNENVHNSKQRFGDECSECGHKFALPPWLHGETHCINCRASLGRRPQRSRSACSLAPIDAKPSMKQMEECRFHWVSTDRNKVHICSHQWCNCSPLL